MEKGKNIKNFKWCNIVLNILIIIFIMANVTGLYGVIANLPFETVVGKETQMVVFGNSMKVKMIIGMILSLVVCAYPLIGLKKIIKSINKKDIFYNENIKILKNSTIAMGTYVLLKSLDMITSVKVDVMNFSKSIVVVDVGSDIGELTSTGFGLTFDLNLLYLISVVIFIVVLIEIIKAGKILKEENDLMI